MALCFKKKKKKWKKYILFWNFPHVHTHNLDFKQVIFLKNSHACASSDAFASPCTNTNPKNNTYKTSLNKKY